MIDISLLEIFFLAFFGFVLGFQACRHLTAKNRPRYGTIYTWRDPESGMVQNLMEFTENPLELGKYKRVSFDICESSVPLSPAAAQEDS